MENVPPLDSEEFTETIVSRYASDADGLGIDACIAYAVDQHWRVVTDGSDVYSRRNVNEAEIAPCVEDKGGHTYWPSYRENQRDAVVSLLHELYVEDNSVVQLSAPTGAGKSLILHGALTTLSEEFGRDAFLTTPLNTLIDQVDGDEYITDDVVTLKGKNNYECIHPHDRGAPVDSAICQRSSEFECQYKDQHYENGGCPYYGRKKAAESNSEVVTNLSYLMANSMIPDEYGLQGREVVAVDECQKIEDFALGFVSVIVSERVLPMWDDIPSPPQTENVEQLTTWLSESVMPPIRERLDVLDSKPELTEREADERDDLQESYRKIENLVVDADDHHWVATHEYDDEERIEFEPIHVGRFLDRFLWSQGQKIILSSATIPKSGFLEEIGLHERQVGTVEVESTFPAERRPIHTDHAVGKMTQSERDSTIPRMAKKIADLADHYDGDRGFVHCHSYQIAERLYEALPGHVRERTTLQNADNRDASLQEWLDCNVDDKSFGESGGGQIFLSVAMSEGISLDGDKTRWQVIAKCAYPYFGDKRVSYRVNELGDWDWYASKAAIELQQAVGRGMRSRDDHCHNYILDTSAVELIGRNEHLFESWFLEAVDVEASSDL